MWLNILNNFSFCDIIKPKGFVMGNKNIEIQIAEQTIDLLKKYKSAKTQEEKDDLLQQMDKIDGFVNRLLAKYTPEELITNITKAISLDQYRPKNLPISLFAINKDLDYVGGDFDTFNRELSQMVKRDEAPETIRKKFKAGTINIYKLAKQFSADWIRRLNNHKDLVDSARKITEENFIDAQNGWVDSIEKYPQIIKNPSEERIIDAYNKLFEALAKDFCDEYDCIIDAKVVKDWATSDIQPNDPITSGYHSKSYSLTFSKSLPESEQEKIKEEFLKDYKNHPNSRRTSHVRVNFSSLAYKNKPEDLFYVLVSVFAHEMHHALDFQQPRQGALGSQIERIDDKIYVQHKDDEKAYRESATEISSYEIEHELLNQLKNMRF